MSHMNRLLLFALAGALVPSAALAAEPPPEAPPFGPLPGDPEVDDPPAPPAPPSPVDPMAPVAPPPTDPGPAVTATAETTPAEPASSKVYAGKIVDIGLKLGGAFNAFNSLGASFTPELEIGVLLPPLDQAFEIFLGTRWASASDEGSNDPDARLPGDGIARWDVTRTELSFALGLRFRIPVEGIFTPYLAAGGRLYLLSTEVQGSAGGESFGKNEETGTAFGFVFQLGGEVALGPGALLLELAINGAALDQTVLADTNVSSFDVYLGYRLFF